MGLAAGRPFVDAIVEGNGLLYAFLGLFITIIPLVVIGSIARKVYKMNYHSIVGMIAGATTDPPSFGLRQHADGKERIRSCIFNGLSLGDVPANPFRSVRSAHPLAVR